MSEGMKVCSVEGCNWPSMGKFCPKCGAVTIPHDMPCPYCKKLVSVMGKFCEECGKPMQEAVKVFREKERKEVEKNGSCGVG